MARDTIARILDIEKEAVRITEDVQQKAKQLLAEARLAAAKLQEEAVTSAREEGARLIAAGKTEADAVRERILAKEEAKIGQMAAAAVEHQEPALEYVLDQVLGA